MKTERDSYSVYNITEPVPVAGPLADLQPTSRDKGFHVARNLLKPLNHLDALHDKDRIAEELGLHNIHTQPDVFEENYRLLEAHQKRQLETDDVIARIAATCGMSASDVADSLQKHFVVRHMEFHPSDVCNLTCKGCTYGHDDPLRKPPPVNYPYSSLNRLVELQPKSMVLIGGGEPTLYQSEGMRFDALVHRIRDLLPETQLALVTNGTFKPAGKWPDEFSWIRLSLDAATGTTYSSFRGRPMYERVLNNYLDYLGHNVARVGVSFLFANSNIHEYSAVARTVFALVQSQRSDLLPKVNIQYRPLRRDPIGYDRPFTEAVSESQIAAAISEVRRLADSSDEMRCFLRDQTNITAILGGNSHPPHSFSRCQYSQIFRIVRASGELRPCFIRVVEPEFNLGNILTDRIETIALNNLFVAARRNRHCDPHGCRQCHVNFVLEQGLAGNLQPSNSPEVQADPMF